MLGIISVFSMLIICSVTDMKIRLVSVIPCILYSMAGIVVGMLQGEKPVYILIGTLPGLVLYIISTISRGEIGKGDAMVFITIGIWLGIVKSIEIFMVALFCTSFCMMPILWLKKKSMKTQVPFIPFVLLSFVIINVIEV